jgi:hypothetical protein
VLGSMPWNRRHFGENGRKLQGEVGVELFFIVAENAGNGWVFWERSEWEARWYPCEAMPWRILRAERPTK